MCGSDILVYVLLDQGRRFRGGEKGWMLVFLWHRGEADRLGAVWLFSGVHRGQQSSERKVTSWETVTGEMDVKCGMMKRMMIIILSR
jgi:hypothetical protein